MSRVPNDNIVVIDLTDSFVRADNRILNNLVINLDTDDSIIELNSSAEEKNRKITKSKKLKRNSSIHLKNDSHSSQGVCHASNETIHSRKQHGFGECPICWDELGKNALASTKCGHVFCLKCLEQSLKIEKKCPTCRKILKSNSAYHRLYLSRIS